RVSLLRPSQAPESIERGLVAFAEVGPRERSRRITDMGSDDHEWVCPPCGPDPIWHIDAVRGWAATRRRNDFRRLGIRTLRRTGALRHGRVRLLVRRGVRRAGRVRLLAVQRGYGVRSSL